jgi:asparagine synthase (glutamine-hydrolysing)
MCGISGIVVNQNKSISLNTLEAMTHVIQHRGPDDEGFVLFDEKYNAWVAAGNDTDKNALQATLPYLPKQGIHKLSGDYKIGFGHRRLSILDLSVVGHMPMCSADEQIWITYNGEVYNYEELRKELKHAGYVFTTETDTEVIINAYLHWGVDCLNRFVGMFAFCLFDKQKQRLLLVRDRFGIKPFYYWVNQEGTLYFGSEIKQFTVCENWKPTLNKKQAFDFLNFCPIPPAKIRLSQDSRFISDIAFL